MMVIYLIVKKLVNTISLILIISQILLLVNG
nr:MAG TPA: hypothetical protein [Caudoviricetes sp.]